MRAPRALLLAMLLPGCARSAVDAGDVTQPATSTRSYRMGFSAFPPTPDPYRALASLQQWGTRADAAIIHAAPKWTALLAGTPVADIVRSEYAWQVSEFRARRMDVVVVIDATNGVDRTTEADELLAAGRSITEPAIQALYRAWVREVVTQVQPVALGLAAETNLIRIAAPPRVYAALVQMTAATAAAVRSQAPTLPLFVTVQVETAWGRMQGTNTYEGVEQDFADFPFTQMLGLSSYPYLGGFDEPEDMPDDWYTRPLGGRAMPTIITEGGWSSVGVPQSLAPNAVPSSAEKQARWVSRQVELADHLRPRYLFQLLYADIDLAAWKLQGDPRLVPFAHLGLTDATLAAKPARAAWDSSYARRYVP